MDSVIAKLEEIETAAENIVAHAEDEKGAIEQRIQAKRDSFDEEMAGQTKEKLGAIKSEAERKMQQILQDEKEKDHSVIDNLEEDFQENHEAYVQEILERIIAV